jgi:hypothetical protein
MIEGEPSGITSHVPFSKRLRDDPEFAARVEAIAAQLRREFEEGEMQDILRSELLTAEDFGIVINARTEDMFEQR